MGTRETATASNASNQDVVRRVVATYQDDVMSPNVDHSTPNS